MESIIDIQWGGYYINKDDDGSWNVFRLLDFNKDSYHAQLFKEKFDHVPTLNEIKTLEPYTLHVPLTVDSLLGLEDLKLLGHEDLNKQALMGYEEYLKQAGNDEWYIKDLIERIVDYSNMAPLKVKLTKTMDNVEVSILE